MSYIASHPNVFRFLKIFAVAFVLIIAFLLNVATIAAQEEDGITPLFGSGKLTIQGAGFKPGENVTLTIKIEGAASEIKVKADPLGKFSLSTNLPVKPGQSIEIDARGDQGSGKAAITAVPPLLPQTGGSAGFDSPIILVGFLFALLGTVFLRRQSRT